jgi:hypothetical protein
LDVSHLSGTKSHGSANTEGFWCRVEICWEICVPGGRKYVFPAEEEEEEEVVVAVVVAGAV